MPQLDTLHREVLAAQQAWGRALVDQDGHALQALLDEELAYVHSSGLCQDRGAYLGHVGAGPRFLSVRLHDVKLLASHNLAVVEGMLELTLLRPAQVQAETLHCFLTQVWRQTPRGWLLRRAQTTRAEAPPAL